MNNKSLKLSLLDNSHAFFIEAVEKALISQDNIRHWQFAILHLVQSLELSIKAHLEEIHEAFIYENIDNPKKTISITTAIERLENSKIGKSKISEKDKGYIRHAIKLRNTITHSKFELTEHYAGAKFFELFGFIVHFQSFNLNVEIEDILDKDLSDQLLTIDKSRIELSAQALLRIKKENIDSSLVWECPNCLFDTLVIEDDINTCYTCREKAEITICPHCKDIVFDSEIESFEENIEYQYEEGENVIYNDYGYTYFGACKKCIPKIKEDIEEQITQDRYRFEAEYYRHK